MVIFDKKENTIDIYSFEGNKDALIEYRRKILEGQDINKLFYCLETTSEALKHRFIKGDELDIRFLEQEDTSKNANAWWSKLSSDNQEDTLLFKEKQIVHEELLSRYINGDFSKVIPTRTFIPDDGIDCYLNSFLVTSNPISVNIEKKTYFRLEDILKLPEQLCTLQLLENGRFKQILSSCLNFDEQLELFNIKQIDSIYDEEIKKMFEFGLLQGAYEDVIEKVAITHKILQRVK